MRFLVVAASFGALSLGAWPQRVAAQEVATNAVYVELGGSAGPFSLNYERRISAARLRIGIAKWTVADLFGVGSDSYTVVPITLSAVLGGAVHHVEGGGGVSLGRASETEGFGGGTTSASFATLTAIAGYRYQTPESRFLFRAVLTPMYGLGRDEIAYPVRGFFMSAGLTFGVAF